jgi:hypothetical protein
MAGVPEWVNRLVLIVMAVGFPLVAIFAWVYEITPERLKPTAEVPHDRSIRKLTGRRLDRAIIAVLAVALACFVIDKFWVSTHLAHSTHPHGHRNSAIQRARPPPRHAGILRARVRGRVSCCLFRARHLRG